jgi:hypothetical protein
VRVAARILIEVLLWGALLVGVLWMLTWLDVRPGPESDDVFIPQGFEGRALRCTALVLPMSFLGLGFWLAGKRQAQLTTIPTGLVLVLTANEWSRIDQAESVEFVSLVAGVGLLALTAWRRPWIPPVGNHRVPFTLASLLAMFAASALFIGSSGAAVGLRDGLVNRPAVTDSGYFFLIPGLGLAFLGGAVMVRAVFGFRWQLPEEA